MVCTAYCAMGTETIVNGKQLGMVKSVLIDTANKRVRVRYLDDSQHTDAGQVYLQTIPAYSRVSLEIRVPGQPPIMHLSAVLLASRVRFAPDNAVVGTADFQIL